MAQVLPMLRDCHPDHVNPITQSGWIFCLEKIEVYFGNLNKQNRQRVKPDWFLMSNNNKLRFTHQMEVIL